MQNENRCLVCGKDLLTKPTRLMEQHYSKKPYPRYINVEKWDLCIECYKEILLMVKEKANCKNNKTNV